MPEPFAPTHPAALVVEHDPSTRGVLRHALTTAGFSVDEAPDGSVALQRAGTLAYDIILVEAALPVLDGLSICRAIRAGGGNRSTPIVIVSSRHGEADTVLGLDSGADDFIGKPFGVRELLARVEAIVRRRRWAGVGTAAAGLTIDRLRRQVRIEGTLVDTTRQEFDLLFYLASRPGVPVTRSALLDNVWPGDVAVSGRTVDALVCRLRRKIERNPRRPERLVTAWGVGYMYVEPPARVPSARSPHAARLAG